MNMFSLCLSCFILRSPLTFYFFSQDEMSLSPVDLSNCLRSYALSFRPNCQHHYYTFVTKYNLGLQFYKIFAFYWQRSGLMTLEGLSILLELVSLVRMVYKKSHDMINVLHSANWELGNQFCNGGSRSTRINQLQLYI